MPTYVLYTWQACLSRQLGETVTMAFSVFRFVTLGNGRINLLVPWLVLL